MDRKTKWLSLVAGCFLLVLGIRKLYLENDWVLLILSAFIIAFSASSLLKGEKK